MTINVSNQLHAGGIVGRTVLFIGVECRDWTIEKFASAARVARALGIDSIAPKRLDGTVRWYNTPEQLQAESKAVNDEGCGYIPFAYCYGPRFGLDFVDRECSILQEMQNAIAVRQPDGIGFVCADLETEWNGQVVAAQRFNAAMQNKHLLYLTSWANPGEQDWINVLNVLRDCINAYVPQAYDDYLSTREYTEISPDVCLQTAVDLSQEFGVNHPIQVAQTAINHGQTSIWIWDWNFLGSQRSNIQGIVQVARGAVISDTPPPPTPAPPPLTGQNTYQVLPGDNLSVIAEKLGISDWHSLYNGNKDLIEHVAQQYGYPNSANGALIFPGTVLTY